MTSIDYLNEEGDLGSLIEVYKLPRVEQVVSEPSCDSSIEPYNPGDIPTAILEKERNMINMLERSNCKVLSVKSVLITKRRYKRRLAKENKRRSKLDNTNS